MPQNPGKSPEIPLNVFAGLVTFQDPVALPMGVSPDCADVAFQPGSVFSRPGFQKVFATAFGAVTVTYGKSYVDPTGTIRNIYLDSSGNLWVENVTLSPGAYTLLAVTTPGSYAKSITAFGREYIAVSDGLHGQEIPLQLDYDSSGNPQLDRVTQDGPGASPSIISLALPSVALANTTPPPVLSITSIFPDQRIGGSGSFSTLNIYVVSGASVSFVGLTVTVAGTGVYDGTYTVVLVPGPQGAITVSAYNPSTAVPYIPGSPTGTLTVNGGGVALSRVNNVVSAETVSPHQLRTGYQAQIAGVDAAVVGGAIASVVIDNESTPGIATVTTTEPHGLQPENSVSLIGIAASAVDTAILSATIAGQVATIVMSGPTGLSPGGIITVLGIPTASFNTTAAIANVKTTTVAGDTFTYPLLGAADAVDTSGTGTVSLNWPIPNAPTPTFFQVQSAPTPTTFQVAIDYPDGTWTGGTVTFAWNGIFYVLTVPTPTTFTYQQYGPNATAAFGSNETVTPYGQAAPGTKQMQVLFLTRQGAITAPSPPVQFIANGGQYYSVSNIPIGPPNVVARIIAFTGAEGAYFFYIAAPPQINGLLVGTATQINDNTTESAIFDFGDPTLYAGLGISIQGNNLANQIVLDGALGFGFYGSRLMTYGQRNRIDNLLNMGFDGGYLPSLPTIPTGWAAGDADGQLAPGHLNFGFGWQITVTAGTGPNGQLSQSLYEDYTGAPIASANTQYRIRVWLQSSVVANDLTFTMSMTSASTGFSSTATIAGNLITTAGGWLESEFSLKTPLTIPPDLTLNVYASSLVTSATLLVDEMSDIFSQSPYLNGLFGSYVNNPEGFDGDSGVFGPVDDTHLVLDLGIIRDNLYLLTKDPSGRLHETSQGITEPADWTISEVAANCGTVSAYALTRSQADDSTAAGGEEWFSWMSATGYRIFGGEAPDKISQEIQRPAGQTFPGAPIDLGSINPNAFLTVWSLNDPDQKIIYLGVPLLNATAPSVIFTLSYLGLDSASAIVAAPPIHRSLSGKLVATDLGRKWAPWYRTINGAALMYRGPAQLQPVFFAGNGVHP